MSTESKTAESEKAALPTDAKTRKGIPMVTGLLDYFPAALAAVAEVSRVGNEQHNPGQPMHHARGKSNDHPDCAVRHIADRGTVDTDGLRHSAKAAWRVLALLQEELEAAGAPLARGARAPVVEPVKPAEPIRIESEAARSARSGFYRWLAAPDKMCNHRQPTAEPLKDWFCTRDQGHSGEHAGAANNRDGSEVRTWPADPVLRHG